MNARITIMLGSLSLLCGCDFPTNWENAPQRISCTPEQHNEVLSRAQEMVEWEKQAGLDQQYPRYWYGSFVMTICGARAKG